jgi:predicted transcriptional regulator
MTLISSREFVTNQKKYFDLAVNERVFVKRGNHTLFIANADTDDDFSDLMLAKKRLDGEFTSADEFITFLRK